jgi:hypothetical protein
VTPGVLIEWEPRWKAPIVEATCPSCLLRSQRRASSWGSRAGGRVRVRLVCSREVPPGAERVCWRVFDVIADAPAPGQDDQGEDL